MTIPAMQLTEIQRQELLVLLNRKFSQMTDVALLEVERLTRHPTDLTGFQAKSDEMAAPKDPQEEVTYKNNHDKVIDIVSSKPVSRREFMAYSATGLLGLLLVGTSYGWTKSHETEQNLSEGIDSTDSDVRNLKEITSDIHNRINHSTEDMLGFQNIYDPTLSSISQARDGMNTAQDLHNQLDQASVNIKGMVEFLVDVGKFFPAAKDYVQPVDYMLKIIDASAINIYLFGTMFMNLDSWFSPEPDRGINNIVLSPVKTIFDSFDDKVKPAIDSIQSNLSELNFKN